MQNHNHDSRYYTESEVNTLVNKYVERAPGLTCSSLANFVKAIKNGTMMGQVKDTSNWAGFGTNSWFKVIVVNQNLADGNYDVDIFMIMKSSNGTNDVYIGRINGKTSYTFSKSKILLYGDPTGGISQPANQQLYLSTSNEANYKLFLGVRDNSWMFGPNISGMLTLGSSKYKWSSVYANNGTIQTSDKKEKHDISALDVKLSKDFIMNLNPVRYKMNTEKTEKYHYGLIAQDVEQAMLDLNLSENDFAGLYKTKSETETNQFTYGLIYSEFIAPIIKTIQSQEYEINELKKEIEDLKKTII